MIRNGILAISTMISVILFPWPFSVFLALVASLFEPLVPLAAGLFADTLYYVPGSGAWPVLTLYGLACSVVVILVRSRLRTGMIGG